MKNLAGKVVLITGGAAGLGKAIAERFGDQGAHIVLADINEKTGQGVARAMSAQFVYANVSDPASVEAAVASTVQAHGRLDVMVNNAGIESELAPMHQCTLANWRNVISVDLDGVFYGMKYAITQFLRQSASGNIVNISSIAGIVGLHNVPPYSAAKAGVSNLTRAAAVEYGPLGIRVNAVAPTVVITAMSQRLVDNSKDPAAFQRYFDTMNPLCGSPTAEDIANAVVFLASDEARFITGAVLPVDGGYSAR
jgi:meso-butanediol dehydrogenase/(S,S)-butanediol dehydrogenase/diacetyl reductase